MNMYLDNRLKPREFRGHRSKDRFSLVDQSSPNCFHRRWEKSSTAWWYCLFIFLLVCQQDHTKKLKADLSEIFGEGYTLDPVYSWLDFSGIGAATWRTQRKYWHSVGGGLLCRSAILA